MRALLTTLLLLLSALSYAASGDYLRATINGQPYAIRGSALMVFHEPGGTTSVPHQFYLLRPADSQAAVRLQLEFTLPAGALLKPGVYAIPSPYDSAGPPWAQLYLAEGALTDPTNWWISNPAESEIIITAIQGKVVEGTFRARLTGSVSDSGVSELTNGAFRFTME